MTVAIESRVQVDLAGCWNWTGLLNPQGYGRLGPKLAHRVSWERAKGPIPDGHELDHLCRNRSCVNPDHLEPVTPHVNRYRAGRAAVRPIECVNGHRYTAENTYIRPDGCRSCRVCIRDRVRRYKIRRASAA